jgi:hypothetical protein
MLVFAALVAGAIVGFGFAVIVANAIIEHPTGPG